MDFNSNKNQQIKSEFVSIHVKACVTGMVEFILAASQENTNAPLSYDDLNNQCYFEDNAGNIYFEASKQDKLGELHQLLEQANDRWMEDLENPAHDEACYLLKEEIHQLENMQEQYKDIYEWWVVSSYLGDKLLEQEETMISDGMNSYWGRTTTGQAILLDQVISTICEEMEILENQKNAW